MRLTFLISMLFLKSAFANVAWGSSSFEQYDLDIESVTAIYSTGGAFAALKNDKTVVTWGAGPYGGDSSSVATDLTGVTAIYSTHGAFAALKTDKTVVAWGLCEFGGNSPAQLTGVTAIYSTANAFAALKTDTTVVTWDGLSSCDPWGYGDYGGDSPAQLTGVTAIYSTGGAFAALKNDKTVVTWGEGWTGGDSSSVATDLTGVTAIYSTNGAFAALKNDKTVVTWGDEGYGTPAQLTGVTAIDSGKQWFIAYFTAICDTACDDLTFLDSTRRCQGLTCVAADNVECCQPRAGCTTEVIMCSRDKYLDWNKNCTKAPCEVDDKQACCVTLAELTGDNVDIIPSTESCSIHNMTLCTPDELFNIKTLYNDRGQC